MSEIKVYPSPLCSSIRHRLLNAKQPMHLVGYNKKSKAARCSEAGDFLLFVDLRINVYERGRGFAERGYKGISAYLNNFDFFLFKNSRAHLQQTGLYQ